MAAPGQYAAYAACAAYAAYAAYAACAVVFFLNGTADATSVFGSYLASRHAQALKDTDKASAFMLRVLEENPEDQKLLRRTYLLTLAAGKIETALQLS